MAIRARSSAGGSSSATKRAIFRCSKLQVLVSRHVGPVPGILRKSSGFGVFAEICSKNIVIPSTEIPFFGEAPQRFWEIVAKFGFFGFLRMTRIAKFGYSGHPNNRITEYSVLRVTRITE
jgi:hypothetical protein